MYHKVVIIGNLTRDPEMRYTPSGTAVTNFTVATSTKLSKETNPECPSGWKDGYQGRNWELTTFWRVTVWRQTAEMVNQFLAKGRQVYVEGTINGEAANGVLNPRVWTGNDGVPRANYEITARLVKFLGGRAGEAAVGEAEEQTEPPPDFVEEGEIPF